MTVRSFLKHLVNGALAPLSLQLSHKRGPSRRSHASALKTALSGVESPLVLDIGANVGQTVDWIKSIYPGANIICFEPNPTAYALLQRKKEVQKFDACNCALGASEGQLDFHVLSNSVSSSLLMPSANAGDLLPYDGAVRQVLSVPVRTLDGVLADMGRHDVIQLMKIDVQGYEDRVLKGGAAALRRTRFLLVEANFAPVYEGACLVDELCHITYAAGFRLVNSIGYLPAADSLDLVGTDLFFRRVD